MIAPKGNCDGDLTPTIEEDSSAEKAPMAEKLVVDICTAVRQVLGYKRIWPGQMNEGEFLPIQRGWNVKEDADKYAGVWRKNRGLIVDIRQLEVENGDGQSEKLWYTVLKSKTPRCQNVRLVS